jgi:hypothetical protein
VSSKGLRARSSAAKSVFPPEARVKATDDLASFGEQFKIFQQRHPQQCRSAGEIPLAENEIPGKCESSPRNCLRPALPSPVALAVGVVGAAPTHPGPGVTLPPSPGLAAIAAPIGLNAIKKIGREAICTRARNVKNQSGARRAASVMPPTSSRTTARTNVALNTDPIAIGHVHEHRLHDGRRRRDEHRQGDDQGQLTYRRYGRVRQPYRMLEAVATVSTSGQLTAV